MNLSLPVILADRRLWLGVGFLLVGLATKVHAQAPEGGLIQESLTVALGERIELTPEIWGAPPLRYQWSKDGRSLPNAVGAGLVVAAAGAAHAGNYRLQVTNEHGVWTSPAIPVGVYEPVNKTVTWRAGTPFTLRARAWGPGVRIYWDSQFWTLAESDPVLRVHKVMQGEWYYAVWMAFDGTPPDSLGTPMGALIMNGKGLPRSPGVGPGALRMRVGVRFAGQSVSSGEDDVTYHGSGLPPGITLVGDVLTGTPTKAGTYTASVWATDDLGKSPIATQVILVDGGGSGGKGRVHCPCALAGCAGLEPRRAASLKLDTWRHLHRHHGGWPQNRAPERSPDAE